VESFFDSLKTEIGVELFATRDQARAAVFDYIERFFNRRRLHSSLDYLSPAEYERKLAA
jgi:putative transposase